MQEADLFRGICGAHGGYDTAEMRYVRGIGGGHGLCRGQEKEWMGCFLDDLRAFGTNADQWTTTGQDEGEWRRTAEQGAGHFMAKCIAAEKVRAGLRHAVVCPNVTGRTKKRILIAQSGANLYPPGVWFADVMSSFSGIGITFVFFVFVFMLSLKPRPFIQSFFVLRYACAPIATRSYLTTVFASFFFFFFFLIRSTRYVAFSRVFLYHCRFIFVWRARRTFFHSGWCFSTL